MAASDAASRSWAALPIGTYTDTSFRGFMSPAFTGWRAFMFYPVTQPRVAATHCKNGFTMIEVLIVVAIIGILASIAYPQYGSFVQKSRRADGQLALLEEVQALERCKSTRYSYANCTLSHASSPENYYAITLVSTASTFAVTATGQDQQASDTACEVMTINQLGERTPDPDTTSCWPG